ncbi:kinase-like domain-containing protein [Leptodontidium sp. 2 PMI_412]|nr:kinase-like domain-containing protein [Leptodontidium sp. 2 PMI_412]
MEDPNVIANLFPADDRRGYALETICMSENKSRYIPPQREKKSDIRSRESTASLDDKEGTAPDNTSCPGLQLAFDSRPKAGPGLVLGTDPDCDIVLPQLRNISRRHCYITFDSQRRLILRDFSRYGTIVSYNDKGRETRRRFTWILSAPPVSQRNGSNESIEPNEPVVIEIQYIRFRIVVSRHDQDPDLYIANVDQFLLGALGFQSGSSTATASGVASPLPIDPIRIGQETLGTGAFAIVKRHWDVSTGVEYAYKEPLNKRRFDRRSWEREAEIMGQISHEKSISMPSPRLILEYIPCGSLEGSELSLSETTTILYQGLSALADLHGREIPIVHRDIKPANILLQSRDPLHIKLTDFGFSRASNDLTTLCGTPLYLAPEVYRKRSYTPAVDIWSLGVVAFECAYSLPDRHGYHGKDWCEMLVDQVNDWENGDLIDLLSSAMIVMDPKLRRSAWDCYMEVLQLSERCRTPTPTSFAQLVTDEQAQGPLRSLYSLSSAVSTAEYF